MTDTCIAFNEALRIERVRSLKTVMGIILKKLRLDAGQLKADDENQSKNCPALPDDDEQAMRICSSRIRIVTGTCLIIAQNGHDT